MPTSAEPAGVNGDTVQPVGVTVVVPAYRSAEMLPELVSQIVAVLSGYTHEFEIILVDDGSGDDTWSVIEQLSSDIDPVSGLTLIRNFGQHNALLAGVRRARHEVIITMDDDLQNPPSEIPRLLQALQPSVDLVYGRPEHERQTGLRNLSSRLAKGVMNITLGRDVYPRISAFRAFRRVLVDASVDVHDPNVSIDVLLSWATNRIVDIDVEHRRRESGRSGYNYVALIRHALTMSTGYSTRPLRWVSAVGVVFAMFGFALLAYVLGRYLIGDSDVAGFTFLGAAITLFSGVQLLSLGVLGEYMGRVHVRSMGKPTYVIRETTALDPVAGATVIGDRRRSS